MARDSLASLIPSLNNARITSMLRLHIRGLLLFWLMLGPIPVAFAQAGLPELAGVLQLVLEDEVAKELQLTDEQRAAVQKIVDERETDGLPLALKVKNDPPEERAAALASFREDTVRQGLKVLSDEQREKLAELEQAKSNPLYAMPSAGGGASAETELQPVADPENDGARREDASGDDGAEGSAAPKDSAVGVPADAEGMLTFNFRYQAWEDVIDWFAQQADLSLLMDSPPQGTFNYTDSRRYTPAEALDVLNSVLLTKGYTLVRKGRMLFVVNLEDEIPPSLVTDVPLTELDERGEYELVRTLFHVRSMPAADAAAEIEKLIGPQGKVVVLDRAGMVQVTETAGRLRTIRSVIDAAEQPMDGGIAESPQLEVYSISGADSGAVLAVLQTLMAERPGVRLATDPQTGNLIALAKPSEHFTIRATISQMQQDARRIEVIPLRNVDPQTAVLAIAKLFKQNVGDDPDPTAPRVDADLATRSLLVRASPSQLEQIQSLLEKMGETDRGAGGVAAAGGNVRIIPLTGSAAQNALTQIERIWPALRSNPIRIVNQHAEIPEYRPSESGASLDGGDWRGEFLEMLPSDFPPVKAKGSTEPTNPPTPRGANQPALPSQTRAGNRTVDQPSNRVRATFAQLEQTENPGPDEPATVEPVPVEPEATDKPAESKRGAPILVAPGPGGTVIASEDTEALDQLEQLLSASANRTAASGREYAVFYLKYAKAAAAAETLGNVFGTSSSGGGGSLMGDIAGAALGDVGGGLVGDLLGVNSTSSSSGFLAGSVEIVPDVRLNALIVNARPAELDMIDRLLRILDQRTGPETVEAGGRPRLIPVYHTQAAKIAEIVQQVFQDRLQSAGGQAGQPSPEDILRMLSRGRGGPGGGASGEAEKIEKMSIGIDERNNALVVRAPDPLFMEVEALVRELDQEQLDGGNSTRVVTLKHSNSSAVRQALSSILGPSATTTTTPAQEFNRARESESGGDRSQSDATQDFARRMEIFRRLREQSEQGDRSDGDRRGGGDRSGSDRSGSDRGGERGERGGDRGGDRGERGGDRGRGDRGR